MRELAGPILIAEDDPGILEVMSIMLTDAGYPVITAGRADTVLRRLRVSSPALLLLDLWMPGAGGESLLAAVRRRFPRVPVVLVSAATGLERVARAHGVGYLKKPFSGGELLATARRHISPYVRAR